MFPNLLEESSPGLKALPMMKTLLVTTVTFSYDQVSLSPCVTWSVLQESWVPKAKTCHGLDWMNDDDFSLRGQSKVSYNNLPKITLPRFQSESLTTCKEMDLGLQWEK